MGAEQTTRVSGRGLISVMAWSFAVLAFLDGPTANAFPIVEGIIGPQGFARRWEAGMPVGHYSQVNLHTGRMITEIPVTGWSSGRPPAVGFALYHNMTSEWSPVNPFGSQFAMGSPGDASGDGTVNDADIDPFIDILLEPMPTEAELAVADLDGSQIVDEEDLGSFIETLVVLSTGPQWTHSYSAWLDVATNQVTLTRDDGTKDVFTKSGSIYISPPGVFDTLTADGTDNYFLTSKSQWKAHFIKLSGDTNVRRLDWIADASLCTGAACIPNLPPNIVKCEYINAPGTPAHKKLQYVKDANREYNVNRKITLEYNVHGKLKKITDLAGRYWTLLYVDDLNPANPPSENGDGAFVELRDIMNHAIKMTYTPNWEIATMSDKNGSAANPPYFYSFAYNNSGQLATVTDPAPFSNQFQSFTYDVITGARTTTYTDRRGEVWTAAFEVDTWNAIWLEDPLLHVRSLAYGETLPQLIHEATAFTDPLLRTWSVDYDAAANVTSSTDPLGNKWTYAYSTDGRNNLLSVTPPGPTPGSSNTDKQVQLTYGDVLSPTSVTEIVEPAATAMPGDSPAVTTLEYHHAIAGVPPFTDHTRGDWGKLRRVTPPHTSITSSPVVTEYIYDDYGQPQKWIEGSDSSATTGAVPAISGGSSYGTPPGTDPAQGYQASCCDGNNNCSVESRDDNGRVTGTGCSTCKQPWACTNCEISGSIEAAVIPACFPTTTGCIPLYPGERDLAGALTGCAPNIAYSPSGEITSLTQCAEGKQPAAPTTRTFAMSYDELGRLKESSITSDEATAKPSFTTGGPPFTRTIRYDYSDEDGITTRTGPDETVATVTTDAAGRPNSFARSHAVGGQLVATNVTYTDAGEVQMVTFGNGSTTDYLYDGAGRVDMIWHVSGDAQSTHLLDYDWSADGLVTDITEFDETGERAATVFTYDNRNRLIGEQRTEELHPYHITYTYDKAGNRLTKTDVIAGRVTTYAYDVQDPALYNSQNNRLMKSRTVVNVGGQEVEEEERYYLYNGAGRVVYAVRKVTGDTDPGTGQQWFTGTQIYYNSQGYVYLAWKLRWQLTTAGQLDNSSVKYVSAMKYRYDQGRQRYFVQRADPRKCCSAGCPEAEGVPCPPDTSPGNTHFTFPYDPSQTGEAQWTPEEGKWSDYDGSSIHGDFNLDVDDPSDPTTATAVNTTAHEPGLSQTPWAAGLPWVPFTTYLHGNLIGTTERMTSPGGSLTHLALYTAFGEPVYAAALVFTRYGYAGAWGYQSSPYVPGDPLAELGWLHVGARYYDPASGRFMQRDPLGLQGGLNTYVYCNNNPVICVDPNGEWIVAVGWALVYAPTIITTVAMVADLIWGGLHAIFPRRVSEVPEIVTELGLAGLDSSPEDADEEVRSPAAMLPPMRLCEKNLLDGQDPQDYQGSKGGKGPKGGRGPNGGRRGPIALKRFR